MWSHLGVLLHLLRSQFLCLFGLVSVFQPVMRGQVAAFVASTPTGESSSVDADAPLASAESRLAEATQDDRKYRGRVAQLPLYDWWRHPGVSVSVGLNGVGVDVAEAFRQRINVRVGAEFLRYTGQFTAEGAQVDVNLRLGGGHAGVDVFPFQHSSFHISPQLRFGILTRGVGNVLIPPGQVVSFSGVDYTSTTYDPLRGSAYFDTRKVAPGIAFGFGNLVPRERYQHLSFPVELGFYYIGQPNLQVNFMGTACSPNPNGGTSCDDVTKDPGFQTDLANFIRRNRHNVSYGSLFPVLSFGVGYRF